MSDKRVATRLSPDERRAQLVDIGLHLLAEQSLDELSTDEVARRAGISRGLLFHYFASKRDFYRAVVRRECERFLAATAPDPDLDPLPWLRSLIERFVTSVLEHRQVYLALVRGAAGSNPAVQDIVDATRETLASWVTDAHRRLALPDSPRLALTARAWMAFAEEAVVNWPVDEPDARAELCRFLEASFVRILGPLDLSAAAPEPVRTT